MNALTKRVPVTSVTFVEPRYWPDDNEITAVSNEIHQTLSGVIGIESNEIQTFTVRSKEDLPAFLSSNRGKIGLFTAMSGGIQPWMLEAAEHFDYVFLCAGYVKDFLSAYFRRPVAGTECFPLYHGFV